MHSPRESWTALRVILPVGLGNKVLAAPMVGLLAPVVPIRGNGLISERVASSSASRRKTDERTVQMGDIRA